MLKIKWVIHGATSISDGVFGIVLGWIGTWLTLDWNGLTSDWSSIGDWSQIGNWWAEDWRRTVIGWHLWVGRTELVDVRIVLRWDTSVGPYSILVPCLQYGSGVRLVWCCDDACKSCVNPFFMISTDRSAGLVIFIWSLWHWIGGGLSGGRIHQYWHWIGQ